MKRQAQKPIQADIVIDDVKKRRKGETGKADAAAVEQLQAMGFSGAQVRAGCRCVIDNPRRRSRSRRQSYRVHA
jgi:hypothetical protein